MSKTEAVELVGGPLDGKRVTVPLGKGLNHTALYESFANGKWHIYTRKYAESPDETYKVPVRTKDGVQVFGYFESYATKPTKEKP